MSMPLDEERALRAAEYVLGVLDAGERRELEQAAQADPALRAEIHGWELRLAPLASGVAPVAPPPALWLRLQRASAAPRAAARITRTWAALATAASLVLGFGLYREMSRPAPAPQVVTETAGPVYVAVLAVPQSTLQWTISLAPHRGALAVRAGGQAPAAASQRDAELWLITDAGPVSLGVIPKAGEMRRALAAGLPLAPGRTLAVSLEPEGGSPTGQPTGPVVTTATLLLAG